MSLIKKTREALSGVPHYKVLGHVERIKGLVIESRGPKTSMGQLCSVTTQNGKRLAEVVGFDGPTTLLMALQEMDGLSPGDQVAAYGMPLTIGLSSRLMGRVINGLGQPIDNGPAIPVNEYRSLNAEAPHPLTRNRVQTALPVGVRAIDGMLTLGQGQRVGIFAGSGVGKSILLGMMAKFTAADVVVVGLIGERGREVREFIEKHLGNGRTEKNNRCQRDIRSLAAVAHKRSSYHHNHRRVLPRSGEKGIDASGQYNASLPCLSRSRLIFGRTAGDQRLSAFCVCRAAETSRTDGQFRMWKHYGDLYGSCRRG